MNILFVTSAAPSKGPFSTEEKRPPLGQGYLIALARERGHQVFFIDNYLFPSNFLENGFLQKKKIDLFGIYSNTICFADTLRMLEKAQELREYGIWTGRIMVGGPHTTVAVDTIPKYVDYVVQGEGEQALIDIIDGQESRRIIKNQPMTKLDWLPFEPWDIFTALPYDFSSPFSNAYPTYTMNTSRGCPFNCAFCSVGSIWGRRYVCYTAERIVEEIQHLVSNYGAQGIYFREDNFTFKKDRIIRFCNLILEKKIKIDWACESRVDSLRDEELVRLMSEAGCKGVYLGVESVNEGLLKKMNKNINKDDIKKCIKNCKKYEINTYCSLITGLPGEKYKDYKETENFMKEVNPHSYCFNVFVGIPRSDLYNEIEQKKMYEYMDEQQLLYLPGYNVRSVFFYGCEPDYLFHRFSLLRRSLFDWRLWYLSRKTRKQIKSQRRLRNQQFDKLKQYYQILNLWLQRIQAGKCLVDFLDFYECKSVAIYGMKEIGRRLYDELKDTEVQVSYYIDISLQNVDIALRHYYPEDEKPDVDAIIVTASYYFYEIRDKLQKKYAGMIFNIEEMLYSAL